MIDTLKKVLGSPKKFKAFSETNNLSPQEFDDLVITNFPEYQKYIGYCNSFVLSYGMHPTPSSIVKAKTMAADVGIPLVIMGICAEQAGKARDILDMLGYKYFTVSNCDIEQEHFLKLFKFGSPKKRRVFFDMYERNRYNLSATCAALDIDHRALFKKTLPKPNGGIKYNTLPPTINGAEND